MNDADNYSPIISSLSGSTANVKTHLFRMVVSSYLCKNSWLADAFLFPSQVEPRAECI